MYALSSQTRRGIFSGEVAVFTFSRLHKIYLPNKEIGDRIFKVMESGEEDYFK